MKKYVKNFKLVKPCVNCPFTKDCLKGWLGEERARGIAETGLNDGSFPCHETTMRKGEWSQCAGALILTEKNGGTEQNVIFRIAAYSGQFDKNKLKDFDRVFNSIEEMVEHHKNNLTDGKEN